MKIALRENEFSNPRCGYCHDELNNSKRTLCTACRAPHHLDCWVENSGCTACLHPRCDRPDEIRELARELRKERVRGRARATRTRRDTQPQQSWISFVFIVQVILAFFAVVLGLVEGYSWIIIAYLAQGIAVALYFAFSGQQNNTLPAEERRRRRPPTDREVAQARPPNRVPISERIRINRVSMASQAEVVGLPVVDDIAHATLMDPPFASLPRIPLQAPPPTPSLDSLPPLPTLPLLPIAGAGPVTLPEQVYHPFHDNLNTSQDFIQSVNTIPAGDSNEQDLSDRLRETLYRPSAGNTPILNEDEIDSLQRDLENIPDIPQAPIQGASLSEYIGLAPLPESNSSEDYGLSELTNPSSPMDPSLGELPQSAAPHQDESPERSGESN
ncbi:MAG: hypothetical protein P1V97_38660 [Planctomycetota bacterium]|nr:hypothetical protein [Planctomycetota bacterium]